MCKSCLSIRLLPEFGWSIKNQHVFGPGSVFQGFVTINNSTQHHPLACAEKIRLIFSCNESIVPYTISPGVIRSSKKTIFSTQKVLWDNNKDLNTTPVKCEYTFPFTIQLPMVQFPPAVEHPIYKCEYKLTAAVDMGTDSLREEVTIIFMPLIETSLLKTPMVINTTTKDQEISASVKLGAQDFVPGDHLVADLKLKSHAAAAIGVGGKKQLNTKNVIIVSELYQTIKVHAFDDVPDQVKIVASTSKKLSMVLQNDTVSPQYDCVANVGLQVPIDLTPSFHGNLVSVSYTLHLHVEQKGVLGGIYKKASKIGTVPVTVGTLGYGIPSSDSLKNYTTWDNSNTTIPSAATNDEEDNLHVLLPKFLQDIEYEDSLPLYESVNLPTYAEATTPPSAIDA